jgi:hypothetical protein
MAVGLTRAALRRFVRAFITVVMRMIGHLIQGATKTNSRVGNAIHYKELQRITKKEVKQK